METVMKTAAAYLRPVLGVLLALGLGTGCASHPTGDDPSGVSLTLKWSTPRTLSEPGSVCYDPIGELLYVSSINGEPAARDGNGFISKVSLAGEVLQREWIAGLNAPKGMGIQDDLLLVADIDEIVAIDLTDGSVLARHSPPGAQFLNDLVVVSTWQALVSDSGADCIYSLEGDAIDTWYFSGMEGPDGLLMHDGVLLVGCADCILAVHLDNKAVGRLIESTGPVDGLVSIGYGYRLFSDGIGRVYLADDGIGPELLLDTTSGGIGTGDFAYAAAAKLLLVPTLADDRVRAYRVTVTP